MDAPAYGGRPSDLAAPRSCKCSTVQWPLSIGLTSMLTFELERR